MTDASDEAAYIEKLYQYGEQLSNSNDKSQVWFVFFLSVLGFNFGVFDYWM